MALPALILAVLLVFPAAFAKDYTVGDSNGWNSGVDYSAWTSGKAFAVGDTLLFSYGGSHTVDLVSKSDYDSCSTGNAIQSYNDGNTVIPLNRAGSMYFVCPAFGHCSGGMKLAVTVSAAGGGSPTPTTPTTPSADTPPTTTPSTPATTTPTTDTPATTTTPTTDTPATTNTPTTGTPATTTTPSTDTPATTTTPPPFANGASSNVYNMMVIGASVMFVPLIALMG